MTAQSTAKRRQTVALILSGIFSVIFFILVLNGGMCERYQRKMERQELMRKYIDSMRSAEQKEKLNR